MVAELRAGAVAAALGVREIAVLMVLLETADIEISLQRPGIAQ